MIRSIIAAELTDQMRDLDKREEALTQAEAAQQ
jgi:hypothetical protein